MDGNIDLGHGLSMSFYHSAAGSVWGSFDAGEDCGLMLWRGEDLIGQVPFVRKAGGPVWAVVQRSPLTVSPSVLCKPANIHGYIRDGRWVPV